MRKYRGLRSLVEKAAFGALAASPVLAQAAIDTTAVTDKMTEALVAIGVVGLAYLGVKIGIKVWPWISSAMGR